MVDDYDDYEASGDSENLNDACQNWEPPTQATESLRIPGGGEIFPFRN